MSDWIHLLTSLSSSDTTTRGAAERQFEALKADTGPGGGIQVPNNLLDVIGTESLPEHLRLLAAVLLRRVFLEATNPRDNVYRRTDPAGLVF